MKFNVVRADGSLFAVKYTRRDAAYLAKCIGGRYYRV